MPGFNFQKLIHECGCQLLRKYIEDEGALMMEIGNDLISAVENVDRCCTPVDRLVALGVHFINRTEYFAVTKQYAQRQMTARN